MEYNFAVSGLEEQGITVWDAGALVKLSSVDFHMLRNLLEDFGQRSAVAQGLKAPITDIWRLRSSDQRLYLQTAAAPAGCCVVLGGLKVGKKKLFLHRANGAILEVEPLCVLDFYVHESCQRQGVGKALFEYMLEAEQLSPEQLGYDRPSSKLLAFLRKHYGLASYVPQTNNFVVFEQFFDNMPGSPGRGGRPAGGSSGSTSSSASCGPGALASVGHGRQTLHIIGSRAAAVTGAGPGAADQWARSSQRPPTPSLQHCVQLHTAQVGGAGGSNGSSSSSMSLGGPGCPTAGTPTKKGEWDQLPPSPTASSSPKQQPYQAQLPSPQSPVGLQVQAPVHYARGSGMKGLMQGGNGAEPYSHAGHQQALLAAAANPAPPRIKAGPLPPGGDTQQQHASWQQQQQQYGPPGRASGGSCRDSLDHFVGGMAPQAASSNTGACVGAYGHPNSTGTFGGSGASNTYQLGGRTVQQAGQQQYAVTAPYGSWEPRPGSLLAQDADEADRVSLRRQAAQLAQQHQQQHQPPWVTAGAGPPGHLLAAPVSTYAVPTADMADVIGKGSPTGRQGEAGRMPGEPPWAIGSSGDVGSSRRRGRQPVNSLCLSWDGLPQGLATTAQQLAKQESGAGYGASHWGSNLSESRAAAATHRSGSGAASCMRMV